MELLRGDADLRTETEFSAIGEARRGVHHDRCGIDACREMSDRSLTVANDRLGMTGRPPAYVIDGLVDVVHDRGGKIE